MSFILESIKQAERERKLGQVPSISVEYVTSQDGLVENRNWMKWVGVSMGLLLLIFAAWIGIMMTSNYFLAPTNSVANIEHNRVDNSQVNIEKEELAVAEIVTRNQEELAVNSSEGNVNRNDIMFSTAQDLRNSELKSIHIINYEEPEARPQIVDNRTKVPQRELTQSISVNPLQSNDAKQQTNTELSNSIAPELLEQKNADKPQREKLYYLYSDLVVSNEKELSSQNRSAEIQFVEQETLRNEEPISSEFAGPVEEDITPLQIVNAVNTGVSEFGELPYDIQEKVPDMNISVHMFNEEASQRRIRINGRMYTEGAKLQPDLALLEITPYGAVFDYQGQIFRLNVR